MSRSTLFGFACLLMLGACHVGPVISEIPGIREPQGANMVVDLNQAGTIKKLKLEGELVDVRDEGLLIAHSTAAGQRLSLATWDQVYRVRATEFQGFQATVSSNSERREESMKKLRLISRFPQGLSPHLLEKLLAGYEQQVPDPVHADPAN